MGLADNIAATFNEDVAPGIIEFIKGRKQKKLREEQLQKQREREARRARLQLLLRGELSPSQRGSVLQEFGVGADAQQANDPAKTDQERLFEILKQFGIEGDVLRKAVAEGSFSNPAFEQLGFGISPESQAQEELLQGRQEEHEAGAQKLLEQGKTEEQRREALSALARKRDRDKSDNERQSALESLQQSLREETGTIARILSGENSLLMSEDDRIELQERQKQLRQQLVAVRQELRKIAGVKETPASEKRIPGKRVLALLKKQLRKGQMTRAKYNRLIKALRQQNRISEEVAIKALME